MPPAGRVVATCGEGGCHQRGGWQPPARKGKASPNETAARRRLQARIRIRLSRANDRACHDYPPSAEHVEVRSYHEPLDWLECPPDMADKQTRSLLFTFRTCRRLLSHPMAHKGPTVTLSEGRCTSLSYQRETSSMCQRRALSGCQPAPRHALTEKSDRYGIASPIRSVGHYGKTNGRASVFLFANTPTLANEKAI